MFGNFSYVQYFLMLCSVIQASGWGLVSSLCISVANVTHTCASAENPEKYK